MKCPRDQSELVVDHEHGIEVDRCPTCNGRWLDANELVQLEAATASTEDERKGMIDYAKRQSDMKCPVCGNRMTAFNYRANPLELDFCDEEHGYWLDAGENNQVRDLVEQRVRDLYRAASAEASWGGFMDGLRGIGKKTKGRRS